MPAPYDIRPLTPALWPRLEALFGPVGACAGCWCMWWRIGGDYRKLGREAAKARFKAVVEAGPPPGILALSGDMAVGWCQVTPRQALPHLERARYTRRLDDAEVWSISCFFIRKGWRGKGVMMALLDGAVAHAAAQGAALLEAYPMAVDGQKVSNANLYTGAVSAFERAGFARIGAHAPHRPIMRLNLAAAPRATVLGATAKPDLRL
jgi:GNAT superfamily N-acetyltransferase